MSVPIIDPRAVYTIATLTSTLGLRPGTLPRELRLRRLRFAKRSGKVWILGQWVLSWLKAGEVHKAAPIGNGAAEAFGRHVEGGER